MEEIHCSEPPEFVKLIPGEDPERVTFSAQDLIFMHEHLHKNGRGEDASAIVELCISRLQGLSRSCLVWGVIRMIGYGNIGDAVRLLKALHGDRAVGVSEFVDIYKGLRDANFHDQTLDVRRDLLGLFRHAKSQEYWFSTKYFDKMRGVDIELALDAFDALMEHLHVECTSDRLFQLFEKLVKMNEPLRAKVLLGKMLEAKDGVLLVPTADEGSYQLVCFHTWELRIRICILASTYGWSDLVDRGLAEVAKLLLDECFSTIRSIESTFAKAEELLRKCLDCAGRTLALADLSAMLLAARSGEKLRTSGRKWLGRILVQGRERFVVVDSKKDRNHVHLVLIQIYEDAPDGEFALEVEVGGFVVPARRESRKLCNNLANTPPLIEGGDFLRVHAGVALVQ